MPLSKREQTLRSALASSRMEGFAITEQTRLDCLRLMDGKVVARTLAQEILARRARQDVVPQSAPKSR